jgi:hypothetical protein
MLKKNKLCIITGDFDFSDIRNYPPKRYHGIIVVNPPRESSAVYLIDLFKNLLQDDAVMARLAGNLIILEEDRIRIRKGWMFTDNDFLFSNGADEVISKV